MHLAIEIFDNFGLNFVARWAHVLVGITWIGLLYYFNFVQVPAFGEIDAGARNQVVDKLASRALWWFRWAAAATFGFGLLLGLIPLGESGDGIFLQDDYFKGAAGIAIATGMLLGITMFLNVWLVIWPKQKIAIANARNVLAGGEADPAAAGAGRAALLASRQNTIFSFPMLMFMIGTVHFFPSGFDTGSDRGIYWAITAVIFLAFELSALGIIGGKGSNLTNWVYENHARTIGTGLVLTVVWYALWELIF
ncbi:MAG TPA: urate hydroxylase PuuD [Acidimicrobiia bacterium]|nr:urate hydroxylase PuuD [Acidimicrobiia bacterium]